MMIKVSSWGLLNAPQHNIIMLNHGHKISEQLSSGNTTGIAHGMGRSYGDVCLNPNGILWNTTKRDHFIAFDENSGKLTCESGVLLRDIQRLLIPRGWMLPVTPGTQLVTVGGAIANDIHGKNHHHFGSFGNHVKQLTLIRTDGNIIQCSPEIQKDWFSATVGGLGLTGVILDAEIQLCKVPSPWLTAETIPYHHLDEFFELANNSETDWENTVSWIDCASKNRQRGLFMRANFIKASDKEYKTPKKPLTMPFVPPISLINRCSLKPFNALYFYLKKRGATQRVHYEPFFYPLDNVSEWNRIYGPKGFYQYQSVVPHETGQEATQTMLKEIAQSGTGSFLSVLKTFGNIESVGMMSFPKSGVTLALDFPNKNANTLRLFDRLDAIVREVGGRIYPAKDARMPRDLFESGYPRLNEFLKYRDPSISSALSRRLMNE